MRLAAAVAASGHGCERVHSPILPPPRPARSIQRILVANPAQRLTIAQIFQHPWVQQVGGGWGVPGKAAGIGLSLEARHLPGKQDWCNVEPAGRRAVAVQALAAI